MRFPATMMLLFPLLLTGCSSQSGEPAPIQSQIGKNCNVFFRRDALGMSADIPSSVTTGSLNGAEVAQAGELLEVGADWIVIGYEGRFFHIPKSAILMVEFGKFASTRSGLSEPRPPAADQTHGEHEHH